MIQLELMKGENQRSMMLRFPATQSQVDQALEELEMVSRYEGVVHVIDIKCSQVENLGEHIGDICLDDSGTIDRLNRLDQALQLMTEKERYTFSGALGNEKVEGLDAALALSAKLNQYLFVPNIKSERELGQFLANTGYKGISDEVLPYISYRALGEDYRMEHGGVFTDKGYVVVRPGHQQLDADRKQIFELHLSGVGSDRRLTYNLSLPASEERLEQVQERLGLNDFAEATIEAVNCPIAYLNDHVNLECPSVEQLNDLATEIEAVSKTNGALMKLCAVYQAEQPSTFQELYNITCDLDDYEVFRNLTAVDYGRHVLERADERDFDLLEELDDFIDYEEYGCYRMREDGIRHTDLGYVRRISEPFQSIASEPSESMSSSGSNEEENALLELAMKEFEESRFYEYFDGDCDYEVNYVLAKGSGETQEKVAFVSSSDCYILAFWFGDKDDCYGPELIDFDHDLYPWLDRGYDILAMTKETHKMVCRDLSGYLAGGSKLPAGSEKYFEYCKNGNITPEKILDEDPSLAQEMGLLAKYFGNAMTNSQSGMDLRLGGM